MKVSAGLDVIFELSMIGWGGGGVQLSEDWNVNLAID